MIYLIKKRIYYTLILNSRISDLYKKRRSFLYSLRTLLLYYESTILLNTLLTIYITAAVYINYLYYDLRIY